MSEAIGVKIKSEFSTPPSVAWFLARPYFLNTISNIANKKQGWRGGSSGRAQRRMEIPL
jgi:hypothetical protein